jgi:hypothetical protein
VTANNVMFHFVLLHGVSTEEQHERGGKEPQSHRDLLLPWFYSYTLKTEAVNSSKTSVNVGIDFAASHQE